MNLNGFEAGFYKEQYQYKSFYPSNIDHSWVWDDPKINVLLEKATQALGELNAFSMIVPGVDIFIHMHILKEANSSSRIEGTRTAMDDVLKRKEDIHPEKRDDWQEVQNYVNAINYAIKQLEKLPLSNRLLQETHAILMEGVRGGNKYPGEFRVSQNWIGGSGLSDAAFIPPHHEDIPDLMGDLEKFWHNETIDVPHLIRIAISHYQFETIHPFLDGNGRIGRLLITLYLVNHHLLAKPTLYLSDFFETHRASYYDALSRVRETNDLIHWIKFFLNAVIITSEKGKKTFTGILKLKEEVDNIIVTFGRKAENARKLIRFLYIKPLASIDEIAQWLEISYKPARELIRQMEQKGLLEEATGFRRNKIYGFHKYIQLF
jgi:Fic family protein